MARSFLQVVCWGRWTRCFQSPWAGPAIGGWWAPRFHSGDWRLKKRELMSHLGSNTSQPITQGTCQTNMIKYLSSRHKNTHWACMLSAGMNQAWSLRNHNRAWNFQDCLAHEVETVLLLLDPDGSDLEDVAKELGRQLVWAFCFSPLDHCTS